jgi:hypothetical protein
MGAVIVNADFGWGSTAIGSGCAGGLIKFSYLLLSWLKYLTNLMDSGISDMLLYWLSLLVAHCGNLSLIRSKRFPGSSSMASAGQRSVANFLGRVVDELSIEHCAGCLGFSGADQSASAATDPCSLVAVLAPAGVASTERGVRWVFPWR